MKSVLHVSLAITATLVAFASCAQDQIQYPALGDLIAESAFDASTSMGNAELTAKVELNVDSDGIDLLADELRFLVESCPGIDETVELLVAIRPAPPGLEAIEPERIGRITYQLKLLGGDPYVLNVAQTTSAANGFAKFEISVDTIENGSASLNVHSGDGDQQFCCVSVSSNDRVAYQVELSGSSPSFLAGGEIPIPVPQSGIATVSLIAPEGRTTSVEVSVFPRFVFSGDVNLP